MCHVTIISGLYVCPTKKLNQVTRPFSFPITICGDSVQYINTEANNSIAVEMYSGYWKLLEEKEACERLEFLAPDGNW